MSDASRGEFSRGWKPLTAALLGTMCGASPLPFNVAPLVLGPVNQATGWDFAAIAAGITIYGLIASLLAPVFGAMADRFGVRPVAILSLSAFTIIFASFYFVPLTLGGWYAWWAVLGLIAIGSTPVTWSRAIAMWFTRNRGLALAIMLVGTSIAAMIVPSVAKWAIDQYGWRAAFPVAALFPLLLALPIALLWFREPRPDERAAGIADASGALYGMTFREAARTGRFWLIFLSILLIAGAYGGAHIHMAQIMTLKGHQDLIATALGVVGIGLLVGRIGVGWLFDRVWAPAVAFPAMLLPGLACFLLATSDTPAAAIALTAAFLLGFAAGAESDVIAFLAARYFGMANYGRIYGMLYLPFGVGSAISPIAYGIVRDRTGSYDGMLLAAMVMFVAGGALLLLLGRYPEWGAATKEEAVGDPALA
jgi:MFS family permease